MMFRIPKTYYNHRNQGEQDHKNVKAHWMSMLESLKWIMAKYRPLLIVMPLCQNMANMTTPITTIVVVNIIHDYMTM
jgi:hypothetical protein